MRSSKSELLLLCVLAFQAGSPISGQTPVPPAAQVEAVKKLDLWVGEWKGTGWASAGRDERYDFTIVEKVQRKVGGSVLLIEGRGTKKSDTGGAVVVHEAPVFMGIGAELAARLMHDLFDVLAAPIERVGNATVPYPPSRFEKLFLPDVDRVLEAVDRTRAY